MSEDAEFEAWVNDFISAQLESAAVEAWVDRVLGRILAEVQPVSEDAALQAVVRTGCRAHWRAFLANLGQPEQTFHLVHEAIEMPRVLAQNGHELPVVFDIYTAAEQEVWAFITTVIAELDTGSRNPTDLLIHFWSRSSTWFDLSVARSVGLYSAEKDRVRQGDASRRLEAVRDVLAGSTLEPREASARLGGHPISAVQTAVLVHTEDDQMIADMPQAIEMITKTLGLGHALEVHPGGRDLWCWLNSVHEPELSQLDECADWLKERRMTVAVGAPAPGIAGFRTSHRDALAAQRIALGTASESPITVYVDVELLTLIGLSDEMRRFVARVLGRLAEPDDNAARLRHTLRVLLNAGSVEAAATRLGVHKNTIRYRLERAQDLMGHEMAGRSMEVEVALRCHEAFIAPE